MPSTNLERMIQLAEDVFAVKNDPTQLDVDQEALERLQKIHPASVSEYTEGNGPIAWLILIPTTKDLMNKFLANKISEKELYKKTQINSNYEAIYLCSALVLEEYRKKGIIKELTCKAILNIKKDHPIKSLFVWAFSKEGDIGAESVARKVQLPLFKKNK